MQRTTTMLLLVLCLMLCLSSAARGDLQTMVNGHIVFRYDRGEVVLVEATPKELRVKGQFEAPTGEGPAWPHPVIYNGRLYLRHGDILSCYDLRG